jgi:IclR family transcriptional regulator, KDG regulon repressor
MKRDPKLYNVRSIERALQILSAFDDEHPERGVSDIAELMGLHRATTHRIMITLLNCGYLERAPDGDKYRLGLKLASTGLCVVNRLDFRREALPYMRQLVQEFKENCDLGVFEQGEVFGVEVVPGNHALMIAARPGFRLPLHCTASGRVFLAFLPDSERDSLLSQPLKAYTAKTITSTSELRRQLAEVQKKGYGLDDEELEVGVRAIAVPIRNRDGAVVAAMSIPGPASRMTKERVSEIAAALLEASAAISARMGWRGSASSL